MTDRPTVAAAIDRADRRLRAVGVEEPRLEARVLLEHSLGLTRAQLYLRLHDVLPPAELAAYEALVARRAAREPLAYVVGHREFFGLDFAVDSRVLVPRPETELLVEEALQVLREDQVGRREATSTVELPPHERAGLAEADPARSTPLRRVADVGTGSGAIAVSLAKHCPDILVYAVDLSTDALAVAAVNARRHGVADRIVFRRGDLLRALPEPVELIVANLPYVAARDVACAQPEVRREPRLALDGGADGLDVYRQLLAEAPERLVPGGALLFEIGAEQGETALDLARRAFPEAGVEVLRDYAGLDRLVTVRRGKTGE